MRNSNDLWAMNRDDGADARGDPGARGRCRRMFDGCTTVGGHQLRGAVVVVSHGSKWPGVRLYLRGRRSIERPKGFFRESGPTPTRATLELVAAPIGVADGDLVGVIENAVAAREAQFRAKARAKGRGFLGRRAILAQRIADRPRTREPRRELSPRIACRNKWLRIEALQRCKEFVAVCREAWRRWCAGDHDVVFPDGTYLLARRFDVATGMT